MQIDPSLLAKPAKKNPLNKADSIQIKKISTYIFKAKVNKPVVSTLTTVSQRVSLIVRIEDQDGCYGWGEIYATLPSFAADHKAQIVHQIIAPILKNQELGSPADVWLLMHQKTNNLQIQTGEFGPFSSAIAGIDCAIWDLLSRKADIPLAQFLGGQIKPLSVYASGLNPGDGPQVVEQSRSIGFTAFKQKIGFGIEIDTNNLRAISEGLQASEKLMVDVNQGWSLKDVTLNAPILNEIPIFWIEEPLPVNASKNDWRLCQEILNAQLAGGENLRETDFEMHSEWLSVIQPDVGKWGGITGNYAVANKALQDGKMYCPHWLGSGIGLIFSAHLLSAIGTDGMLEMDVNENPLRELLAVPFPKVINGKVELSNLSGIGVQPDVLQAKKWQTHYQETFI